MQPGVKDAIQEWSGAVRRGKGCRGRRRVDGRHEETSLGSDRHRTSDPGPWTVADPSQVDEMGMSRIEGQQVASAVGRVGFSGRDVDPRLVRRPRVRMAATTAAVLLITASAAFGQVVESAKEPGQSATKPASATARTHPNDPTVWNVDQMMEEAVLQISRRYNLNKAQEEYTRLLLIRRTRVFLSTYEDQVRQLLKESIELRLGLRPGTPEALMDWAERAAPIYEAAKEAILEGNDEWRDILNDEQKKLHDSDLSQMQGNFANVDRVLQSWRDGRGSTTAWGVTQPPAPPPAESGVVGGQVSTAPAQVELRNVEDNWLAYVERFIQIYKLDEKQQNSAKARIHKEMMEQAREYRDKHKADFEKLEAELRATLAKEDRKTRREELLARRSRLEGPIRTMFVHLDRRLRDQLLAEQRAGVDPEQKRLLDKMYDELAIDPLAKSPKPGPGVKPTPDTQPAEARGTTTQPASQAPPTTKPVDPPELKPVTPPPATSKPSETPPPTTTQPARPAMPASPM